MQNGLNVEILYHDFSSYSAEQYNEMTVMSDLMNHNE